MRRLSSGLDSPGVVHKFSHTTGRTLSGHETESYTKQSGLGFKLVVVMVGLPARGKSYISKKLKRYLSWLGFSTRVFNVGNLRRQTAKQAQPEGGPPPTHSSSFFDSSNTSAKTIRDNLAMESLDELIDWLQNGGGKVGIHDATNTTIERRRMILRQCAKQENLKVMFVESICTDPVMINKNVRMKLLSPDYANYEDKEAALQDFKSRLANYEKVYQTICEEEEQQNVSYCKIINVGAKLVSCNIHGYLSGQVVFYLMNLHLCERQIWITRHGESYDNVKGTLGGDSSLTPSGVKYAKALARFIDEERKKRIDHARSCSFECSDSTTELAQAPSSPISISSAGSGHSIRSCDEDMGVGTFNVWTSMLLRSIETVEDFDPVVYDVKHIRFLNEIYAGKMENLTYHEIKNRYPEEYKARQQHKLFYRYPGMGGESYLDMVARLNPIIVEIERMTTSVLIVTHTVVMRTLLAYMMDISLENMTRMEVPLHTLYCLDPKPHGTETLKYRYIEAEDRFEKVDPAITLMKNYNADNGNGNS